MYIVLGAYSVPSSCKGHRPPPTLLHTILIPTSCSNKWRWFSILLLKTWSAVSLALMMVSMTSKRTPVPNPWNQLSIPGCASIPSSERNISSNFNWHASNKFSTHHPLKWDFSQELLHIQQCQVADEHYRPQFNMFLSTYYKLSLPNPLINFNSYFNHREFSILSFKYLHIWTILHKVSTEKFF